MKVATWNPRPDATTWGPFRLGLHLRDVLAVAERDGSTRVMLSGPPIPREWFTTRTDGWDALRVFPDHETPAARYRHAATGHEVEVRRAAEWFGGGDYSHNVARAAWEQTGRILNASGKGGAFMFRSPGATGLDLWLRGARGDVPDPIDADMQAEIRRTTAQHRIEILPPKQRTMPGMWVIDGRWMYAALTREIGTAPARRLTAREADELARDEYAPARYRVTFAAPPEWSELGMIGLILAPVDDDPRSGWHAPPSGTAWVDAAELQLARRWGWRIEIHEAIAYERGRPLDTWSARLIRARDAADKLDDATAPLVRSAVRSILLHAVGSWHSAGRRETSVTSSPMIVPDGDGWGLPDELDDGRAVWTRPAPDPSPRQAAMRHPEWSARIWGRAHARILESPTGTDRHGGALYVDPRTLVSIYGDAIMTTKLPDWALLDDGKPGRLRVKGHVCGPVDWPTSARERDELVRAADAAGTQCTKGCE